MHRLVVLACLWRHAAPALQYHVDIDGSHATIAYEAGNATAAARAFVAEFDIQTHGTCEDAACVEELVEAELDAFAPFDVVSCQFAIHYAFKSEATARCCFQNIAHALRPGGFLIGAEVGGR